MSKHVTPASTAAWIAVIAAASSRSPYLAPPIGHVPMLTVDTEIPLVSNSRDSIPNPFTGPIPRLMSHHDLGSRKSLSLSPKTPTLMTTRLSASPGIVEIHQAVAR